MTECCGRRSLSRAIRTGAYDPATGTFLTRDSLDGEDGHTTVANPYHYADNDPLNRVDPLGLRPGKACANEVREAYKDQKFDVGRFERFGCDVVPVDKKSTTGECGFGSGPDAWVFCLKARNYVLYGNLYSMKSGCLREVVLGVWQPTKCGTTPTTSGQIETDNSNELAIPTNIEPGIYTVVGSGNYRDSCGVSTQSDGSSLSNSGFEPFKSGMCQYQRVSANKSAMVVDVQMCPFVCITAGVAADKPFITVGPYGWGPIPSLNVGATQAENNP
ncbi:MAG: hypothetical protein HYX32_07105 [Actinobacteria bacterium]|nr:hypothetical protein [Actinomycetota bacterium]